MEDLISRRAAIDAIEQYLDKFDCIDANFLDGLKTTKKILNDLPSAQPEQVCVATVMLTDEQVKEAIEKAKNAVISVIEPEPHWIPCSERLPERADNVIICYKAGDYTLVSTGIYLYKFKMWYVDVVGDLRDGVTAWMPLPEPYRGGDSE